MATSKIKRHIKWWLRNNLSFFHLLGSIRLLCTRRKSYLFQKGWVKSILKNHPCDRNGEPLPWMNYAVLFFIAERLTKTMTILEFGSGYSTLYWAKHVKRVFAVENDPFWANIIIATLPKNTSLILAAPDSTQAYEDFGKNAYEQNGNQGFDVIINDGERRMECCMQNLKYLNTGGVIIWDDSDRISAADIAQLAASGFKKLEFEGLKPAGRGIERTAVFYKSENCLGI